jgi:glutamate-1-semialdehyde 2,1-aminomutase
VSIIDELDYYASVDLRIFSEEFDGWLPGRIFDVHTHAWLPEHCLRPFSEERVGLVFEAESVSVGELEEAYSLLFPGRQVDYLAFGMPLTIIDREANNAYIAGNIDGHSRFGLLVPGLKDDAETLWAQVRTGGFSGFKPYLSYVTWKDIEAIRVTDFVTEAMLEAAHAHGLIIMLHVPRNTRLPDPDTLDDLEMIAARYPNARVILAHGGRAYSRGLIERALDRVAALPNMYFDFSVVQSADVVEAICARMPAGRVMYGSDIPVAAVRGLLFMLNGQRVTLTRKPFPWSLSNPASPLRCTFMGYEQLRAMKRACDTLGWGAQQVDDLFYGTARRLVDAATAAVRGG